jgi:hypothetical protein
MVTYIVVLGSFVLASCPYFGIPSAARAFAFWSVRRAHQGHQHSSRAQHARDARDECAAEAAQPPQRHCTSGKCAAAALGRCNSPTIAEALLLFLLILLLLGLLPRGGLRMLVEAAKAAGQAGCATSRLGGWVYVQALEASCRAAMRGG